MAETVAIDLLHDGEPLVEPHLAEGESGDTDFEGNRGAERTGGKERTHENCIFHKNSISFFSTVST